MNLFCVDRMYVGVVEIILRDSEYWKNIPRMEGKKYECENQKTIKVDVSKISLRSFGQ